jgi:hypothetical protein
VISRFIVCPVVALAIVQEDTFPVRVMVNVFEVLLVAVNVGLAAYETETVADGSPRPAPVY